MRSVYRPGPQDYQAVVEAVGPRRRFGQPGAWLWYLLGTLNIALLVFWAFLAPRSSKSMLLVATSVVFAGVAFAAPRLYGAYMQRAWRNGRSFGQDVIAHFTEGAIESTYGEASEHYAYETIRMVDDRPGHILFWIGRRNAVVLPKRALPDEAAIRAVIETVERRRTMNEDANTEEADPAVVRSSSAVPWVRRVNENEPVFEKTVTPTFEDHLAVDFNDGRLMRPLPVVASLALAGLATGCFFGFEAWRDGDFARLSMMAAAGIVAGFLAGALLFLPLRWALTKFLAAGLREQGSIDRPVRLRFDRTGIETELSGIVCRIPWPNLIDIETDAARYFFWLTTKRAVVICRSAFPDEAELKAFDKALADWYGRAPRTPPRMARERSLPPEAASNPTTDNS